MSSPRIEDTLSNKVVEKVNTEYVLSIALIRLFSQYADY